MKKALILMLALLLVVTPVLCACGDDSGDESGAASQVSGTTSSDTGLKFPLEARNFGGTTITVLCRPKHSSQQFCPNEEYENSAINEAVNTRNQFIEEAFGLVIDVEEVSTPATEIKTMMESNIDDYDLVCDSVCRMLPTVTESMFYSLNDMLKLDQPYWDQNANNYLTLSADKIFFVTGDALFQDDLFTSAVLFNKDLWNQYYQESEGSLYDIVRDKKWTIDKMGELAKGFSQADENGNWTTPECMYGIVTDGYSGATHLTAGSNIMTASKDENGEITLHVGDERSVKAFDKVYNILNDNTISMYVEQLTSEDKWSVISNMFASNHALFQVAYINSLMNIKENENPDKVDPGVVPIPMFDEAQADEGYFDGINIYQLEVIGIPTSNSKRLEETAYLLEALGYYSSNYSQFGKDSVTYATYETTLKLQSVTSDDDTEMMDYIMTHRLYDLGGIFDWGGKLTGAYSYNLYNGQNTLVSSWDANKDMVEAEMKKTIEAYKNSIA